MHWSDSKQGLLRQFSVRKGALKGGLTPVFDYIMAGDTEDRTEACWKCITDQEAANLLEHGKFRSHVKMKLFYYKDNKNRNAEGLWNPHPGRYSKLV